MKRRITVFQAVTALLFAVILTSCQKQVDSVANAARTNPEVAPAPLAPAPLEERSYFLFNEKQEVVGTFKIQQTTKDDLAKVVVYTDREYLPEAEYQSYFLDDKGELYAKLNNVVIEQPYTETFPVMEATSGAYINYKELMSKTAYTVQLRSEKGVMASGYIK